MIEIDDVSCDLGGVRVLDRVSLTIPKAGVTALVGPNGAGKSTLLGLMARLAPLQSGRIAFDGLDVATTPTGRLALKLAILRQSTPIAARLTVRELVGFGRYPHHRGRPRADDRAAIDDAIETFELAALQARFVDDLSGGERQRALVAMTFCQGADYLLLDEPLNNLDMYFARNLMRRLRDMARSRGRTIVVVLHEVNYAAAYADRIVGLNGGRVVAEGALEEIFVKPTLRKIFGFDIPVERIRERLIALHHD